jgi:hypothetical protein
MGIFLNNGVVVKLATVDLSSYTKSCTVNQEFDEVEVTAMGATAHQYAAGLENGSFDWDIWNDLAAAKTNATLQANFGTTVALTVQQSSAATSATNPLYSTTVLVNRLAPINGSTGEYSGQSLKLTCNSKWVVTTS